MLSLRRGKGMVLDPADPDTVSAGSFFTNPVVDTAPEPAAATPSSEPLSARVSRLEEQVASLTEALRALKEKLGEV